MIKAYYVSWSLPGATESNYQSDSITTNMIKAYSVSWSLPGATESNLQVYKVDVIQEAHDRNHKDDTSNWKLREKHH